MSKAGNGSPRANHRPDAFDSRQQAHQFALHFEDDLLCAARRHERRIAHELDGVAGTLLGVQQDGFAVEGLFAEPQRRREIAALRSQQPDRPARFVAAPAGGEIAERQSRHASTKRAWAKSGRATSARLALISASRGRSSRRSATARLVKSCAFSGADAERAVIDRKRLRDPIEFEQRVAVIAERIEMIGIGGERAFESFPAPHPDAAVRAAPRRAG